MFGARPIAVRRAVIENSARQRPARKKSAGLLLYRSGPTGFEVLLVHPGGPFWRHKDAGAWSIPKGEIEPGEDELDAARREFAEETGYPPKGAGLDLGSARQAGGKLRARLGHPGRLGSHAAGEQQLQHGVAPAQWTHAVVP